MKVIDQAKAWWERVSKIPWVAHLIRAGKRFTDRMGNQFGAALTYFSFLSIVPLLMVAFAAAGFILSAKPHLLEDLKKAASAQIPGPLTGQIIEQSVNSRVSVGLIGLAIALYSGVGWMANVREAVQAQWRPQWEKTVAEKKQNFVVVFGRNLLTLIGLGVSMLISIGLTTVGGAGQTALLEALNLQDVRWLQVVLSIVPFLLAVLADIGIFMWFYTMMAIPDYTAPKGTVFKGSVIAAVGFEVLKVAMTFLLPRMTTSPTFAVFGSVISLLFFFFLVARLILFVAAWIGTAPRAPGRDDARELPEIPGPPLRPQDGLNAAGATVLAGSAAAAGFVGGRAAVRRRGLVRRG